MVNRKHTRKMRGGSRAAVASGPEARRRERWRNGLQLPGFRQKPDGVFIRNAETVRDKYSTNRKYELANSARPEASALCACPPYSCWLNVVG